MAEVPAQSDVIEKLVSLSKQRGFVYPSSEIYGGLNAVYDFGPLGVRLRPNIRERWGAAVGERGEDLVGVDGGAARRRRGHRNRDPDESRGVGRQRSRRGLHGSTGRLPRPVQAAL